jgi:hypothetical protein
MDAAMTSRSTPSHGPTTLAATDDMLNATLRLATQRRIYLLITVHRSFPVTSYLARTHAEADFGTMLPTQVCATILPSRIAGVLEATGSRCVAASAVPKT